MVVFCRWSTPIASELAFIVWIEEKQSAILYRRFVCVLFGSLNHTHLFCSDKYIFANMIREECHSAIEYNFVRLVNEYWVLRCGHSQHLFLSVNFLIIFDCRLFSAY